MKKNNFFLFVCLFMSFNYINAKIDIKGKITNTSNASKEIIISIINGSIEKKIGSTKLSSDGSFSYKNDIDYVGFIKLYLTETNYIDLITDNTTIVFDYDSKTNQFTSLSSEVNTQFFSQNVLLLKDKVLPSLISLQSFYKSPQQKEFSKQLNQEIEKLNNSKLNQDFPNSPFLDYYFKLQRELKEFAEENNPKLSSKEEKQNRKVSSEYSKIFKDRLKFDSKFLENSGSLQVILMNYYSNELKGLKNRDSLGIKLDKVTESLLNDVVCESERGQNILQLSLDVFKSANLDDLYTKYLGKAEKLTCEIKNDRLKTILSTASIKVGEILPNYTFNSPIKGKKSLYDIKSKEKLLVFYASWCGHCVTEMPKVSEAYPKFKSKGVEFIVISLDSEKAEYEKFTKTFPSWFNYTELKGWDSPISREYGIDSTPTFILLDDKNKIKAKGNKFEDILN